MIYQNDAGPAMSKHYLRMETDPVYRLNEIALNREAELLPCLFYEEPKPKYDYEWPEPPEMDSKGYLRIRTLEDQQKELRLIITNLYRQLTEGTDINTRVRAFKEQKTVQEMQDKETEELLARARRLK